MHFSTYVPLLQVTYVPGILTFFLYILFFQLLKEAGFVAGVTHRTGWFSFNEDGIAIAVLPY